MNRRQFIQAVAVAGGVSPIRDADPWSGRGTTRRVAEGSVEATCDEPHCIIHKGTGIHVCPLQGLSTTTTFASLEVSPTVTGEYI